MADDPNIPSEVPPMLLNIFRSADKNDDNKISLEEFKAHFADGVLSDESLVQLFNDIDTDNNENIECDELLAYFLSGYDNYKPLFDALEAVNSAINSSIFATARNYSDMEYFDQFKVRFLLNEALQSLESMMHPIDACVDKLELETRAKRATEEPYVEYQETVEVAAPSLGDFGRRSRPSGSQAGDISSVHFGHDTEALRAQVSRLEKYLDNYQAQLEFDPVEEERVEDSEPVVIVHREFEAQPGAIADFRDCIATYLLATRKHKGLIHLYTRHARTDPTFFNVYEIWSDQPHLYVHYASDAWRHFARDSVEMLQSPGHFKQLPVPSAWFPGN